MKNRLFAVLILTSFTLLTMQSCHILRGKNKCDDCPHWSKVNKKQPAVFEAKNTFAQAQKSTTFGR